MKISIRRFDECDIKNKVKWINDPRNNTFLHYDLPLEYEKTLNWWRNVRERTDRFDAVIEVDGIPCGLIGLLGIDCINQKAEYYISMGEVSFKGKGIATRASKMLLEYAFGELGLNRVYLFTEVDNILAQRLFEKVGFIREGKMNSDLFFKGKFVDRYVYGINKADYFSRKKSQVKKTTPIFHIDKFGDNRIYIKREDMIPISFGGNKARKAIGFFEDIDASCADCIVTYGSSSSNHCRIISNLAASRKMDCYIVSPEEANDITFNSRLMEWFGAIITVCHVDKVHDTIEALLNNLRLQGRTPYFIPGGGHGNIGTQAYVDCYSEIVEYENESGVHFDYVFHASGTGTTQAGLVCGKLINKDDKDIVGISIARSNPNGRKVVIDSVKEYLGDIKTSVGDDDIDKSVIFDDSYIAGGYGKTDERISDFIKDFMRKYSIPLDHTYTAKAYVGMLEYLKKNDINGKNILFIHTGGTPLFFDEIKEKRV